MAGPNALPQNRLTRRMMLGSAGALLTLLAPGAVGAQEVLPPREGGAEGTNADISATDMAREIAPDVGQRTDAIQNVAELPPQIGALEIQMLALVNGARASRGVPVLEWDGAIAAVARSHAADMMRRGVVSHTGADGSTPTQRMRRAGVNFRFGSENIWTYWGKVPEMGPSTMHSAMMAEPYAPGLWNHIGNILYGGYSRIGIGIVTSPSGVQYLAEKFADRA